jgi:hypothetical protein
MQAFFAPNRMQFVIYFHFLNTINILLFNNIFINEKLEQIHYTKIIYYYRYGEHKDTITRFKVFAVRSRMDSS